MVHPQGNELTGSIPSQLKNLEKFLNLLDLSYNSLSGEISKSLASLLYLSFLNLSFNRLEGELSKGGTFANLTPQSLMGHFALIVACRLASHIRASARVPAPTARTSRHCLVNMYAMTSRVHPRLCTHQETHNSSEDCDSFIPEACKAPLYFITLHANPMQ
ncbi:hypothetical protein QJS04_geneDACA016848 [Acorus gramineus]|uniref:Uncharacterized protein n=1 Tax=Acorus gramineus TaxID=55184 RepID=A0AAV9APW6_ACOGR|nr:hypothetical protein QJS04_geneDACA016848 [Acorus gramineus]